MVRLSRIYTRSGDDGTTGLGDGSRVPKDDARIRSYGGADELGAVIGLAVVECEDEAMSARLLRVQNDLFDLGADLCVPGSDEAPEHPPLRVTAEQVAWLEGEIDAVNANLEPLNSFVLSGGSKPGAWLHLARCVARRCERDMVELAGATTINTEAMRYINRLSDFLFVMAREANRGGSEVLWTPGGQRDEPEV